MFSDSVKYPLISVISVSYNCVNGVDATIDSLVKQIYPNIEYIVIDNQSTDGTIEKLKSYSHRIDCLLIESDQGPYHAMNKGLSLAKGEWIWFMNIGDRFPENPLLLKEIFSKKIDSQIQVIYGNTIVEAGKLKYHKKFNSKIESNVKFGILSLNHQSIICNKRCFEMIGYFDFVNLKIKADAFWLTKVLKEFGPKSFYYFNSVMAIYDETGISSNYLNYKKMYNEDIFILNKLGTNYQIILLKASWLILKIRIFALLILKKNPLIHSFYHKVKFWKNSI
jgi:glycosyltransferase involved in cell wall biosynthesis